MYGVGGVHLVDGVGAVDSWVEETGGPVEEGPFEVVDWLREGWCDSVVVEVSRAGGGVS